MEQCDCTADCGDCPGLKLGTHAPCDFKSKNDLRIARYNEANKLTKELGYSDALSALQVLKAFLARASTNTEKTNVIVRS